MTSVFRCGSHQANATEFCLCGPSPVYLCAACIPNKHDNPQSHDVFPMAYLESYSALGNDKAELKRRSGVVRKCEAFLGSTVSREAAILTEARTLITDLARCYEEWLDQNHRCFNSLIDLLRREVNLFVTAPQIDLSPLTQLLVHRNGSLSVECENYFCAIPEKDTLDLLTTRTEQAILKAPMMQQLEYEAEVLRAFKEPSPAVQPVSTQGDAQKLIAVLQDKVCWFDVAASQWQQLYTLSRKINVNYATSSTFIPPATIFLCGGGEKPCTCHVDSSTYVLQADGSIQELPHMSAGRNCPGATWDSGRKALYVFGGRFNGGICYTVSLHSSEMFLSKEWSSLPDMHHGRRYFNPCWHAYLVYLCGGYNTNSVETYNPQSNTFTLQNFTLPESDSTTSVVECGVLTVISKNHISKLQQGRLTSQQHKKYYPWSNCTPLVSGGEVYIVDLDKDCCRCIDLNTGAERKVVSISIS